ncbi:hypothetical protein [Denitrobaculum tricleocarpae]|uniref:Uncharacterized protein n=1 Tax=Denitrobaculum tricleocarpae TaxID=2591009 RepID=A0A545U1F1_9PROT|nr:hypothetical protein [Denitrobaculum tricleocarpae]TQV83295.1 hypothetical protein FKG95_01455 [Denitrobaculum tricleocarpae]
MPTWITVLMLTPMALWLVVYGFLFFITDGDALIPGIGAGPAFTFAFPLCGLWMLLEGLISGVNQLTLGGLFVLLCMGFMLSATYLFRRFGDRKNE